ncbi:hypothetical protein [Nocardia wallacei]|uniref:hypothetical protein n=1 Tax=Nocardia wallacei TaxID=480035 RepID=UPI001656A73E|nr:hypothetical protein [Nocardia wallacei]
MAVDVGSSYGVSTRYLAQAIHLVSAAGGEPEWSSAPNTNQPKPLRPGSISTWPASTDTSTYARELRDTLRHVGRSAGRFRLDRYLAPHGPARHRIDRTALRRGAVVVIDNAADQPPGYRRLFDFLGDPANGLVTQTLPLDGGMDMAVTL